MQTETLILDSTLNPAGQDQAAVAAVREGDAQRYRELVERHERRVYAVAWSRLGDATLAEEATQEAFIRGYRHLRLLGDGAKFSAWIGTIARNAAISLGLRQRRELDKRVRWGLEQPVATEPVEDAAEQASTSETLRRALADLPAAHRECLVLFYIEGKSGAEAAAALGISEGALRVRLVRARAALRERMEERLGESLEQLRPGRTLVPSVMAVVMSGSTAKVGAGGGFGVTLAAAFAKVLPFKVAAAFVPVVSMVPALGLSWWLNREERRNYRDAEGFRAKLHRNISRGYLWFFGAFMVVFFAMHWVNLHFGWREMMIVVGVFSLISMALTTRQLALNRSGYQVGVFTYSLISAAVILATAAGWLPMEVFSILLVLTSVFMIFLSRARPMRMDYNLFLRANQGLLKNSTTRAETGGAATDRAGVFAFARFLGRRYLAVNYRWTDDGLMLAMPSVAGTVLTGVTRMAYLRWSKCSWILLGENGGVRAQCRSRDEEALATLGGASKVSRAELEAQVARAVGQAWRAFRAGDITGAERVLGQVPEEEVFVVPPVQSRAMRWRMGLIVVFTIFVVACAGFGFWSNAHKRAGAEKSAPGRIMSAP